VLVELASKERAELAKLVQLVVPAELVQLVVPAQLAAKELAAKELAAKELAAKELAAKELAAKELVAKELAAKELAAKAPAQRAQRAQHLEASRCTVELRAWTAIRRPVMTLVLLRRRTTRLPA
jgi:hypothetical protein